MIIKTTLAAAALALSAPAFAAETDLGTAVVFGDLDLGSAEGAAQLERRIRRAAAQTCGYRGITSLDEQADINACRKEFVSEANSKLQLAYAASRNGRLARSLAAR